MIGLKWMTYWDNGDHIVPLVYSLVEGKTNGSSNWF
ncbi:unnamed protein product [Rhodiola kirilowii]